MGDGHSIPVPKNLEKTIKNGKEHPRVSSFGPVLSAELLNMKEPNKIRVGLREKMQELRTLVISWPAQAYV